MTDSIGKSQALGIHLNMDVAKFYPNIFQAVYKRGAKYRIQIIEKIDGTGRPDRGTMNPK